MNASFMNSITRISSLLSLISSSLSLISMSKSVPIDNVFLIKMVIIGNYAVGKSSLLMRFADKTYKDTYTSTIGVDFKIRTLEINGKTVKVQIWDTAGQERFKTITLAYYRGCDCAMFVFDVTCQSSFDAIKVWQSEMEEHVKSDAERIHLLVGNKSDLINKRVVSMENAKQVAKQLGMNYVETSAKLDSDVDDAFRMLISDSLRAIIKGRDIVIPNSSDVSSVIPLYEEKNNRCCRN